MKQAYLLSCQCGRAVEVDSTQAGLPVTCQCGASLTAPTMRDLVRLPRAGGDTASGSASGWGPRQGVAFVGALVALIGLAWTGWQIWSAPRDLFVRADQIRERAATLAPAELSEQWRIASGALDPIDLPQIEQYRALQAWHRRWTVVAGGVLLLGIALAVGSRFVDRAPRPRGKAVRR